MVDALGWEVEEIPNPDHVLMRAHRSYFHGGHLGTGVFRPQGPGMSVNWDKYASPVQTREQATKNPEDNAVIILPAGGIRDINGLSVIHTPEQNNRAHTDIFGIPSQREQLVEVRMLLGRIFTIVLPLAAPSQS